ncbi:hypothetical protein E3N88_36754 [Mikania micrantha]|uniref:Pentacotripeptide-repeat region of PRORP domain-containing protein n=1 Tax=Mikania micrantha TaxID=192012 RepID=A0A5N6M4J2_9ASTR|nr:hypothetical protein E3N88_36754 [Mikania micrantha]
MIRVSGKAYLKSSAIDDAGGRRRNGCRRLNVEEALPACRDAVYGLPAGKRSAMRWSLSLLTMLVVFHKALQKQTSRTTLLQAFTSCSSQNPRETNHNKSISGNGNDYSPHDGEFEKEVAFKFTRNHTGNNQEIQVFRKGESDGEEIRHPLVKEVCRLIDLKLKWNPNLERELRQLIQRLNPLQVCAVLQNQSDARISLQLFYWADRLWRYRHHPVVYIAMLEILSKTSLYQGAKRVIRLMTRRRIKPHPEAYGYLMISYSRAGDWRKALQVLFIMEKSKVSPNLFVYNVAVYVLIKACKLEMAMKMLNRMELVDVSPNVVTYNCLIKGYCDAGRMLDAMDLIEGMHSKGCLPDKVSYHILMGFYCKDNRIKEIKDLMDKMLNKSKLTPDQVTYNMLIHMLSKYGHGFEAISFAKEAEERGFSIGKIEYSAIIHSFCQKGDIDKAKELVNHMCALGCMPDVVTYTDVINGLCSVGKVDEAKTLLQYMRKLGCKPNTVSYTALLKGLCINGKSSEAKEMLNMSEEEWWVPNSITYSVLMHGFRKEGKLNEARDIISEMIRKGFSPTPAEINLLIQSLCQQGRPDDAKKVMEECLANGCDVNVVNFTTVIHEGDDDDGIEVMSCFVIEINPSNNREKVGDSHGIDEAIAWAKQKNHDTILEDLGHESKCTSLETYQGLLMLNLASQRA